MSERDDDMEEIELFIERMKNGGFIFTAKATELRYVYGHLPDDTPLKMAMKTKPLAVCLDYDLDKFQKSPDKATKKRYAKECKMWIQTMWVTGSIQESQGLVKKLEECEAENLKLEQDLTDLSTKYQEVSKKLDMFSKKFPPLKDHR